MLDLWRSLPEGVVLVTRTARNRVLYSLPEPEEHPGPGRPPSYGQRAPNPGEWLHRPLREFAQASVRVRGRDMPMRYRVIGPLVREGLPERPLFLLVVRGVQRRLPGSRTRYLRYDPAFYLVSAVRRQGRWVLPLPILTLLAWLWQRWEIEVAHRELKTGWGLGEKQCWNRRSAVVSVQWDAWAYAVFLLAGYRTWGLTGGPATPARWWPGTKRWSLSTLWRAFRAALWGTSEFRALWTGSSTNWWEKETWLAGLRDAVAAASRI